jgi:hypothetical protein
VELAATLASDHAQRKAGIPHASTRASVGITLPLGLFIVSQLLPRRARTVSAIASLAALTGGLLMCRRLSGPALFWRELPERVT